MDLIIMLIIAGIITVLCAPFLSDNVNTDGQSITANVICSSSFVAQDLPYCDVTLCHRVKCFTYYQEVLGLWHS